MRAVWLTMDPMRRAAFIQLLEARRTELGLSWAAFAARAGIGEETLHRYRRTSARWLPEPQVLRKLAVALDVPYPRLLRIVYGDAAPDATMNDDATD